MTIVALEVDCVSLRCGVDPCTCSENVFAYPQPISLASCLNTGSSKIINSSSSQGHRVLSSVRHYVRGLYRMLLSSCRKEKRSTISQDLSGGLAARVHIQPSLWLSAENRRRKRV